LKPHVNTPVWCRLTSAITRVRQWSRELARNQGAWPTSVFAGAPHHGVLRPVM
jgi:hypothetical protein